MLSNPGFLLTKASLAGPSELGVAAGRGVDALGIVIDVTPLAAFRYRVALSETSGVLVSIAFTLLLAAWGSFDILMEWDLLQL